ncbi:MAG: efflux RND transporter periplasmic adaptor subunit [Gemmatimonadota bacterium]|nr:efflux RND transporter periplasmic adaptor subunit [Gemmatimonadota bacterium]
MKRLPLVVPAAFFLAIAGCGGDEQPGRLPPAEGAQDVAASPVAALDAFLRIPARVVADRTARLATRTSGRITAVLVDVGAAVRAGQPLVRLDDVGVESGVAAAEAEVTVARRSRDRLANLFRDGAATEQELDQATARLEVAEARLREARAQRAYVTLRAPFDGTVTSRSADPGDLAVPGVPVLDLAAAGHVKVQGEAPAQLVAKLAVGDAVRVLGEGGRSWPARVSRRADVLDGRSDRFRVEVEFAAGARDLPVPGSFARLEVGGPAGATLFVPGDAIVRQGQLRGVYTIEDGILRLRWIRPGRADGDGVEVLAGLSAEALVVRSPAGVLRDGLPAGSVDRVPWRPAAAGSVSP